MWVFFCSTGECYFLVCGFLGGLSKTTELKCRIELRFASQIWFPETCLLRNRMLGKFKIMEGGKSFQGGKSQEIWTSMPMLTLFYNQEMSSHEQFKFFMWAQYSHGTSTAKIVLSVRFLPPRTWVTLSVSCVSHFIKARMYFVTLCIMGWAWPVARSLASLLLQSVCWPRQTIDRTESQLTQRLNDVCSSQARMMW